MRAVPKAPRSGLFRFRFYGFRLRRFGTRPTLRLGLGWSLVLGCRRFAFRVAVVVDAQGFSGFTIFGVIIRDPKIELHRGPALGGREGVELLRGLRALFGVDLRSLALECGRIGGEERQRENQEH